LKYALCAIEIAHFKFRSEKTLGHAYQFFIIFFLFCFLPQNERADICGRESTRGRFEEKFSRDGRSDLRGVQGQQAGVRALSPTLHVYNALRSPTVRRSITKYN